MWDKFIELSNKSWAVSLAVTSIIGLSIGLLIEAYPFLFGWILGFSIIGMIITLALVRYKRRQWAKEDEQDKSDDGKGLNYCPSTPPEFR